MAEFRYRTKGNASPKGKPRVYFTSHPEDFSRYFETVCEDILKTQDCAIFYTEDMTEKIEDKYKESDLGQMNLFVIPVTFKLLSMENRAMDSDFRYAKEKHIPVLPIMMESGLDVMYSRKDRFGELQYLDPYAQDATAIAYGEKLKKYLDSVLISNEMAERVRRAFDAYIFLSYRKKDRHFANELMKRIHSYPEYRDIAIWYDEFLTPGESFRENIDRMMKDSKLFTLLVTPNLLEYVNGEPNYVMAHEYPDAKNAGMSILPTEMVKTDKDALRSSYEGIPECVDPNEDEAFQKRLAETLSKIAISGNNDDAEHNFLIGLAYLDGIDVETDSEKGIALITAAAEAGLLEAMKKLYLMYQDGKGVQVDYRRVAVWAERIVGYCKAHYGDEHPDTLTSLHNLAFTYGNLGDHRKALELQERVYALRCKILGEEHPSTLTTLNNLAVTYYHLGDHRKTLKLQEKVYALQCKALGEEHPDTLNSLSNLAVTYGNLGDHRKELELQERVYTLQRKVLGEEHPDTLTSLNNLAVTYYHLGDHRKALELHERVYALQRKVLGEEHPDTLKMLNNLAFAYGELGDHRKALEFQKKVYALQRKVLGEEHPDTLTSLNNLAVTYYHLGDHRKVLELRERVYALQRKALGEEHPLTLKTLNKLAFAYSEFGNHQKALELHEKVYALRCKILGQEHPDTLNSLSNLAVTYGNLGDHRKALELKEKVYAWRCKILGEEHPHTLISIHNLAFTYGELGDYRKALELNEKVYAWRCKILGEEHPNTLISLHNLAWSYNQLGDTKQAAVLMERAYTLRAKVLGEDHPLTVHSLETLKQYRAKLGAE